jgi:eukaryotic-like serine/threonine-protein kinase
VATDSLRGNGKPVVIKRVAPWLTKDVAKADAYVATAQEVAKRLRHPNVVELRAVGAEGKDVFLVMEYLQGETLARFLRELHKSGQTLQTSTAAYIVAEACAGLDAAHRAGIVHGHLTPYDVFIGYDGTVRILDVGVAAAKVAAVSEGEIAQVRDIEVQYSSPEVCRGQTPDKRSDVFSLGAMLWELLTGLSPFERAERAATIRAICDEVLAAPNAIRRDAMLPGRISEITMDALARDADKRCPDAAKLRQLLLGFVGADKPARAEVGRLMARAFERRIADKAKLVACITKKAPAAELANLDITDDPMGLEPLAHGADLDAKSPSGVAPPTGGAVTAGPKVVVHRPQSDPSMRTTHPVRKSTAPLPPPAVPPIVIPPIATAPIAIPPVAIPTPDSTPSAKPPRVPFYEDDEQLRRARQEPTSLVARPGDKRSDAPPAIAREKKARTRFAIIALVGTFVGIAATVAVLVFVRGRRHAQVTKPVDTVTASASATTVASSAPAPIAVEPPPSASVAASPSERAVLSIDTVPSHATISINGEKKGKSPLELKLPKSSEEIVIEIQHPGYVTMKERVVPDVNQRLKLQLVASGAGAKAAAKPASTNPYKKFE